MYDFAAVAAAADPYQEGECSVHAMAFMPVSKETKSCFFPEKTLFLVCLVSYTGFHHSYQQLHCLAVDIASPKPSGYLITIAEGPWPFRNVPPSTTILQHVTALQCTAPGVVSVSSSSIDLLAPHGVIRLLCNLHLAGIPTAIQHLQGCKWAVTDTMAELWIIELGDVSSLCKFTAATPLTVAHFMCLVSGPEAEAEGPISLFLGSRTDTSQLVSIPKALLQGQAQGGATSQLAPPAEGSTKPLLDDDSVQRLVAFDCAAPIHDAVVFQDPPGRFILVLPYAAGPPGCGEWRLVMGCGVAPGGSLRLAHLAAKLTPSISGGPHMPGGPRLMAVKADWQQQHHAYLAFSFPLEGATSLLHIQGTHFQPITLPGLNPDCSTLLLAALPGGWMVQVTEQEVRILDKDALVATWDPPDRVSIAASCGSLLALVHADAVTVVTVKPTSGQVKPQQTLRYPQQVSAIAILEPPNHESQEGQGRWLAVGVWAHDTVLLQCLSEGGPSCRLDCADVGQPRSIVAAEMHGTHFLFVGTSQGWVVYHPITWSSPGGLGLEAGGRVHAGITAAHLTLLPAHGTTPACVYAQSSKALMLRPTASKEVSDTASRLVEAVRVHGGEGVSATVGVHAPDLPHSLAWLDPRGRLNFGEVDHATHLRWFTLGLEDTPQHVAYHQASGHAAVLSSSPSGASWLRLVHAASLTQVVALQLGRGHTATALCTARLPTSSVSALHQLPGRTAPEKEFVLVASLLEAGRGTTTNPGRNQGLLSVFEVCPAGTAGSAATRYQLKLHGSCHLDSPCYSLATAPVQSDDCAINFGDRHQDDGPQVVLAGCEGEVHMYSLFVDDSGQAGQEAVAIAGRALAQGEPLPQVGTPSAAPSSGQAVSAMAGSLERLGSQGWTHRVRLHLISKVEACASSHAEAASQLDVSLTVTVFVCSDGLSAP
ncbi:hypothetical protein ABBQ38_004444 [Trebouxia sp. C0009 RCD-2024]